VPLRKQRRRSLLLSAAAGCIGVVIGVALPLVDWGSSGASAPLIVVSGCVFLLSLVLLKLCIGTLEVMSFHLMWFLAHMVMIYIGSIIVFLQRGAEEPTYLLSTALACLLFPLGGILANVLFKFSPRSELLRLVHSPLTDKGKGAVDIIFCWFVVLVGVSVCLLYLSEVAVNPFLALIRGGSSGVQIATIRETASQLIPHFYRYQIVINTLLPFSVVFAFLKWYRKRGVLWGVLCLALGAFLLYVYQYPGNRIYAILPWFFVTVAITIGVGKRFRMKHYISLFMLAVFVLTAFFVLTSRSGISRETIGKDISRMVVLSLRRLTITQTTTLFYRYKLIPSQHDFLYGLAFPDAQGKYSVGNLLWSRSFDLKTYVADVMYPNSTLTTTAPSVFYGDVYANFGVGISMLSVLIMGFLLQLVQIWFARHKKTAISVGFYSLFVLFSLSLGYSGLVSTLIGMGPFTVALLSLVLFLLHLLDEIVVHRDGLNQRDHGREDNPAESAATHRCL